MTTTRRGCKASTSRKTNNAGLVLTLISTVAFEKSLSPWFIARACLVMATSIQRYSCAHCDGERQPNATVKGSFCSRECWYKHKGRKALNTIQFDHTVCGTCGRVRATVENPRPEGQKWYLEQPKDGTFTYNPESDSVDFETWGQTETIEAAIGRRYSTPNEQGGACKCGTISTVEAHDILRNIELDKVLVRLFKRLREKERDGELSNTPDKDSLFSAFKESNGDFAYAAGRALYE